MKTTNTNTINSIEKRSSDFNKSWDEQMGKPIDRFNPGHLPTRREVLQRYRSIRYYDTSAKPAVIAKEIATELMQIWSRTLIPHKDHKGIKEYTQSCIEKWLKMRPEKRNSKEYQVIISFLDLSDFIYLSFKKIIYCCYCNYRSLSALIRLCPFITNKLE